MVDDLQVIEDGVDSPPGRGSSQPSWVLGVIAFALGVGLGALVNGSPGTQGEEEPPATTTNEASPPASTLSPDPADLGVAATITDFPDAIVAIARNPSGALDHVLWPVGGEPRVRSITAGERVLVDSTGHFVAMSDGVPDLAGSVLSVGRFRSIRPVASGVVSYAWHDSRSAALSYTALARDGVVVAVTDGGPEPEVIAELPFPAVVVGWGDWGWALQQGDEIILLSANGEFRDSEPGIGLDTHPSGWAFAVEDGKAKLVSAGGGVRRIEGTPDLGEVIAATFAPAGNMVAFAGERGLAVVDLDSNEVRFLDDVPTTSIAWSSDSRFVLVPTTRGVLVFDLGGVGAEYRVLQGYSVAAAGVAPLSTS